MNTAAPRRQASRRVDAARRGARRIDPTFCGHFAPRGSRVGRRAASRRASWSALTRGRPRTHLRPCLAPAIERAAGQPGHRASRRARRRRRAPACARASPRTTSEPPCTSSPPGRRAYLSTFLTANNERAAVHVVSAGRPLPTICPANRASRRARRRPRGATCRPLAYHRQATRASRRAIPIASDRRLGDLRPRTRSPSTAPEHVPTLTIPHRENRAGGRPRARLTVARAIPIPGRAAPKHRIDRRSRMRVAAARAGARAPPGHSPVRQYRAGRRPCARLTAARAGARAHSEHSSVRQYRAGRRPCARLTAARAGARAHSEHSSMAVSSGPPSMRASHRRSRRSTCPF